MFSSLQNINPESKSVCICCLAIMANPSQEDKAGSALRIYSQLTNLEGVMADSAIAVSFCGTCEKFLAEIHRFQKCCLSTHEILTKLALLRKENKNMPVFSWIEEQRSKSLLHSLSERRLYNFDGDASILDSRNADCDIREFDNLPIKEENALYFGDPLSGDNDSMGALDEEKEEPIVKNEMKTVDAIPRDTDYYTVVQLNHDFVAAELEKTRRKLVGQYSCDLCAKAFIAEDTYGKHMRKHVKLKSNDVECDLCHQFLPSKYSMKRHLNRHLLRYECKVCGVMRSSPQHLKEHYSKAHQVDTQYECLLCGETFPKRNQLSRHKRSHSSEVVKLPCDKCGKLFSDAHSLRAHVLTVHSNVEAIYQCELCPRKYSLLARLINHKKSHIKTRDHHCHECNRSFKTRENLKVHLKLTGKHMAIDGYKYPCEECDKKFLTSRRLQDHIMWEHRKQYKHRCDLCEKTFHSDSGLKWHTQTSHIKDPAIYKHACEHCDKRSTTKSILEAHTRTHTGEQPYPCDICGRKFSQKASMQTHVKLVHLKVKRDVKKKGNTKVSTEYDASSMATTFSERTTIHSDTTVNQNEDIPHNLCL